MSKKTFSWRTKICLYKSLILPVLLYVAETWTLTSSDEQAFVVFERKILLKIYGPFYDRGEWRIRWNQELYDIYDDIAVVQRIKIHRLRWLGHVAGMDSSKSVRQRWTKQGTENVITLGIRNWRQAAIACDVWRRKLAETTTYNRL